MIRMIQKIILSRGFCSSMLRMSTTWPSRRRTSLPPPLFSHTWCHPHRSCQSSSSSSSELYNSCFRDTHPGKPFPAPVCESDNHSPSGTALSSSSGSLELSHSSGRRIPSCNDICSCRPLLENNPLFQCLCICVHRNRSSSSHPSLFSLFVPFLRSCLVSTIPFLPSLVLSQSRPVLGQM